MSSIEWTDQTWNPVVGCSRISHGCDHCYAIKMATRLHTSVGHYQGVVDVTGAPDWSGVINIAPDRIVNEPLRRTAPTVYFVNSMSDMFHEAVRDEWIVRFFKIMNGSPRHTFQVLTKRPSRMAAKTRELGLNWTTNIWAGASVESGKYAKPRVRELLKVPASLRFVSAEPLLSALPSLDVAALDWVISGGESGNARTVRKSESVWHEDLRNRCRLADTPFFFKQWGAFGEDGTRRSKSDNGHMLEGKEIFEMPAVAYDRLRSPDHRWTRIAPRAEQTPTERYMASGPLYVAQGKATDSDDDHVLSRMRGDRDTYQNPNRFLMAEKERRARLELEEAEARWASLLGTR